MAEIDSLRELFEREPCDVTSCALHIIHNNNNDTFGCEILGGHASSKLESAVISSRPVFIGIGLHRQMRLRSMPAEFPRARPFG
jgi:hypothetical protein